jgi:hypothetical protein
MLNIFSHHGNANQNHTEISSLSSQNDYHKENKIRLSLVTRTCNLSYLGGGD